MSYYTAIRHVTPRNIITMYAPSREYQKVIRKASPATRRKMNIEERTRIKYLALHYVNKRAKETANFAAKNNSVNHVQNSINSFTRKLKTARSQNWANTDNRLHAFYPYPRSTLRKIIYYLKQHKKRLEFAKFLAGRKVAEMMMPKARANFMKIQNR